MRVVDTSAWIEWLSATPIGHKLASEFPALEECVVPTVVQLELAKWAQRELDELRANEVIATTRNGVVVDLDTVIALRAAELCHAHKLTTTDAIIYATTLEHDADLLTCDAHFEGMPHVVLVSKRRVHEAR